MTPRRQGVTALVAGVAAAALLATAAGRGWYAVHGAATAGLPTGPTSTGADMPLALALALVVLAGWGALLVTRGGVRRVVATLVLLAAAGEVAAVASAPATLSDQLRQEWAGATGGPVAVGPTGWFVTAAVTAPVVLVCAALAWWRVPALPAMSRRYDAPAAQRAPAGPAEDLTSLEVWRAIDEGEDPTDRPGPRRSP